MSSAARPRIRRPSLRLVRVALGVFHLAPWAWLLAFGTLFTLTVAQVGHVPSYGDPDPKRIVGAWPLMWAIYLLLIPTLLSPAVVLGETVVGLRSRTPPAARALALWAAGFALFGAIAFADAFGLMTWLLD